MFKARLKNFSRAEIIFGRKQGKKKLEFNCDFNIYG